MSEIRLKKLVSRAYLVNNLQTECAHSEAPLHIKTEPTSTYYLENYIW